MTAEQFTRVCLYTKKHVLAGKWSFRAQLIDRVRHFVPAGIQSEIIGVYNQVTTVCKHRVYHNLGTVEGAE